MHSININDTTITIENNGTAFDGRDRFLYKITTPGWEYVANDIHSGCNGCSEQEAMDTLLSFLGAAAAAVSYGMFSGRASNNADLFPDHVMEWAYMNSDEISVAQFESELLVDEQKVTKLRSGLGDWHSPTHEPACTQKGVYEVW